MAVDLYLQKKHTTNGVRPQRSAHRKKLIPAGLAVFWDPRFQSLLELAEARDVPVRWSRRTGVCHIGECGLISGSVMYDPELLAPSAAGNLLICCSRSREDLIFDISKTMIGSKAHRTIAS